MDALLDKRERILSAAAKLIVENGLRCSMSAIAETAGVATGSLYNYFKSKDDLVIGVYTRLSAELADGLITELAPELGHKQRIERYVLNYIDVIWQDQERAILFEYLSNVPLLPPGELGKMFEDITRYITTLLTEAQADGVLKPLSVDFMGGYIGGGIRNTLKWRRADPRPLTAEERMAICELCWSAIAAPGAA